MIIVLYHLTKILMIFLGRIIYLMIIYFTNFIIILDTIEFELVDYNIHSMIIVFAIKQ